MKLMIGQSNSSETVTARSWIRRVAAPPGHQSWSCHHQGRTRNIDSPFAITSRAPNVIRSVWRRRPAPARCVVAGGLRRWASRLKRPLTIPIVSSRGLDGHGCLLATASTRHHVQHIHPLSARSGPALRLRGQVRLGARHQHHVEECSPTGRRRSAQLTANPEDRRRDRRGGDPRVRGLCGMTRSSRASPAVPVLDP